MSEIIISARDVTKTYRLYNKPHYRFLDVVGLLRGNDKYSEHHALHGINLHVKRGEKVALIGRNGAGKSTLLKIITGVTAPTAGTINVHATASALLQIGTTFHPEFTGRENVLAYLSHLGITGKHADTKLDEIIDFSELEEYIDQPVKTYSTGMGARLMFSASTAIQPDLLVIDEILSVGDAYFSQKSFERIREMCESKRTTLLLVSHDIYAAAKLCERMVWIDRGGVMIDGPSAHVMKAYEDSIRVQEESRLRRNRLLKLEAAHRQTGQSQVDTLLVEICTRGNEPLPQPIAISRIAIEGPGNTTIDAPIADVSGGNGVSEAFLDLGVGVWGDIVERDGKHIRYMLDHGSPFNKIVVGFPFIDQDLLTKSTLHIDFANDAATELLVRAYRGKFSADLGAIEVRPGGQWISTTRPLTLLNDLANGASLADEVRTTGVHGTGIIRIVSVRLLNSREEEVDLIKYSEVFAVELKLDIRDREFDGSPQILLAFQKDGVLDVCRTIERGIRIYARQNRAVVVKAIFPRCQLGNGAYALSVMIAEEGYYDKTQTVFFSINPGVYACLSRVLEFSVAGGGIVGSGTGVVVDASWNCSSQTSESSNIGQFTNDQSGNVTSSTKVIPNSQSADTSKITLNFPQELLAEFPIAGAAGLNAVSTIWAEIKSNALDELSRNSPALKGFDWSGYLRLSAIRFGYAHQALRQAMVPSGRVLDFGSYFGNFALALAELAYEVDVVDSYKKYGLALAPVVTLLNRERVNVLDFDQVGYLLEGIAPGTYDSVFLMGVIEHLPHTPKNVLLAIDRVLRPGGVLILDTPNLAYEYKRCSLLSGNSVYPPIQSQFDTEIPFEGHHREYVTEEILWMLGNIGHQVLSVDHFNYSCFGLKELSGADAYYYRMMQDDPLRREIILTASKKSR